MPCKLAASCQPTVEFEVNAATPTSDAQCAPVAIVDMYFTPIVPLTDLDGNGQGLQNAIVAAIVNRTDLTYVLHVLRVSNSAQRACLARDQDVLDVILEISGARENRRRSSGAVPSAQTTYRSVANAKSVETELEQSIMIEYNTRVYEVCAAGRGTQRAQ